jgi:hypothetical protein
MVKLANNDAIANVCDDDFIKKLYSVTKDHIAREKAILTFLSMQKRNFELIVKKMMLWRKHC